MSEGYCDIHKVQMKEIEGAYGKFWSHATDDESYPKVGTKQVRYCNGKPPKGEKETKEPMNMDYKKRHDALAFALRLDPNKPLVDRIKIVEHYLDTGTWDDFKYEG